MRDRIEQRAVEPLRLAQHQRLLGGLVQQLALDHQRDLVDECLQQLLLVKTEWRCARRANSNHADGAPRRLQRQELSRSSRQRGGVTTGALAVLEHPGRYGKIILAHNKGAGPMHPVFELIALGQQDGGFGMKDTPNLLDGCRQHIIHVDGGGRIVRQCIERSGAVGVVAGKSFLLAQASSQITCQQGNHKVEQEEQNIRNSGDGKRQAWAEKQIVPRNRAGKSRQ